MRGRREGRGDSIIDVECTKSKEFDFPLRFRVVEHGVLNFLKGFADGAE